MVQTSSPEIRETGADRRPPPAPEYSSWISQDRSTDAAAVAMRQEAAELVERVLEHYRNNTTHEADGQWTEPVANYLDADRWQREMDAVHRTVPLPLAMSAELPGPNTYKALDVLGVPVLITRDRQGTVHAMINACRHRGAKLDRAGLRGVQAADLPLPLLVLRPGRRTAGRVRREDLRRGAPRGRSLVRLPAGERAGIVFVSLDPAAEPDLDAWLGDLQPLLEGLRLADCHHYSTSELTSPNWKVTLDGYLETYHFASLHPKTVFETNLSNMMAHDTWGPISASHRPCVPIAQAVELPAGPARSRRVRRSHLLALPRSGDRRRLAPQDRRVPRAPPDGHRVGDPADHPAARPRGHRGGAPAADRFGEWFHEVVRDEDYATTYGVQQGLDGPAGTDFVFGRNEPGLQHFHRTVHGTWTAEPPGDATNNPRRRTTWWLRAASTDVSR